MVQVTVTVDDQHESTMGEVVAGLRAAGMHVDQVLDGVGMVTGTVDDAAESSLHAVPGVQSVDRSLHFQVPPPDSPIQ